ncbi:MAG: GTPase Era [Rhodospirillales bacterium]|nr:GTPase Era [Rhodospirillales bacterium]
MTTRCGFIAVIGAPNAGKSTLINQMVGSKVTIVSPKVQTTRTQVRGIALHENSQIIFVDTPGIFVPKKRLERAMVAAAWAGNDEADMVVLVVDASAKGRAKEETAAIIDRLVQSGDKRPCFLVLNKVDCIAPEKLLKSAQELNDRFPFQATFMVSALKGKGTDDILNTLAAAVPEGPFLFPEDQSGDMPMRFMAAEITREKLYHRLHQELPYSLAVETENWEQFDNGSIKISQIVYVSREAHKPIVLGKGGQTIKAVGQMARKELEDIMGVQVHLKLFVKVHENWADDPERYEHMGLDFRA